MALYRQRKKLLQCRTNKQKIQEKREEKNILQGTRGIQRLTNFNCFKLTSEKLQAVKLWITAGPREKFTAAELELLKQRLDSGGGLLVMLREGGELKYDSNINFLLEEFGIMVNNDAVIRNVYHKYFHPKEALVSSGVLNREISRAAGLIDEENTGNDLQCLRCDHGTYIRIPLQGHIKCDEANWLLLCFNVCVFNTKAGKLAVLGSCHMFSDQYLDKEENSRIMDVVFQWLTADSTPLNQTDAEDPELSACTKSEAGSALK
uniref:Intraflagellar transport 52 homolog (Chlamydomonas) n=1 Tax=Cyprinus carpio TaxID=7962 RepID=A0A8C1U158_CYPCA